MPICQTAMEKLPEIDSIELKDELLKIGHKRQYCEPDVVFGEGEAAEFLPIVIKGSVKLVKYPELGKEVILGIFRDGEIFAIPPAIDGKSFPATAVAMEDTEILAIPREKFLALMRRSPEFSQMVMARMCGLLRETAETIQNLATSSPEQRVGNVLMKLAKGEKSTCGIRIKLRRQDIAEMAGLTTETTIRAVKRLEEKKLLSIVKGKIILEKPELLRDFLSLL